MTVENQNDINSLMAVGRVVATARDSMLSAVEPGMTTRELDDIGAQIIDKYGATSAPKLTYDFPGTTCISVNEQAAHGVPGDRVLRQGDVVNVDVSAELNGYYADTGATTVLPPVTNQKTRLCFATKKALDRALTETRTGQPINGLGKSIQSVAKRYRFKVIRNLAGHGLGRSLHEEPQEILGYFDPEDNRVFRHGAVVAIEPFLSTKSTIVSEADDGWTLVGHPLNLSAQFEHTVIVTRGRPIIVTL